MSDFSAREFFDWLEKLPVQQQWDLSLDDISVIQTWLYSAGYSVGIDQEQLAALNFTDEDTSFQDAMERLSLGFFSLMKLPLCPSRVFFLFEEMRKPVLMSFPTARAACSKRFLNFI